MGTSNPEFPRGLKMSQSLNNFSRSLGANKVCWVILSKIFGSLVHHQELVCVVFWNAASLFNLHGSMCALLF